MHDSNRLQRLQQTSLWDFALAFYAKPNVEGACLTLQDDANIDVCELLFHCWLYCHGLQAEPFALMEERKTHMKWQKEVTSVLRQLRRDLKRQAIQSESITVLRGTIQQAELQAERENLQCWEAWACADTESNKRVTMSTVSTQKVARWLQSTLICHAFDSAEQDEQRVHETTLQAFQVLASQLDRFE